MEKRAAGGWAAAERKETGRVSNGRIRIKRKIKVNAFRRLCRVGTDEWLDRVRY